MRFADETLFEAVRSGNADAVREALACGANPNSRDPREHGGTQNTPLHAAADAGNADIVGILLAHGAQVDAQCDGGWTPLMRACNGGFVEVARILLTAGANPNVRNREGYSAHGRVPANCPELLALLRKYA